MEEQACVAIQEKSCPGRGHSRCEGPAVDVLYVSGPGCEERVSVC